MLHAGIQALLTDVVMPNLTAPSFVAIASERWPEVALLASTLPERRSCRLDFGSRSPDQSRQAEAGRQAGISFSSAGYVWCRAVAMRAACSAHPLPRVRECLREEKLVVDIEAALADADAAPVAAKSYPGLVHDRFSRIHHGKTAAAAGSPDELVSRRRRGHGVRPRRKQDRQSLPIIFSGNLDAPLP